MNAVAVTSSTKTAAVVWRVGRRSKAMREWTGEAMTEKELRAEEKRLDEIIHSGEATVALAERLIEVRRFLLLIESAKYNRV
jgi:hypothetical protein